MKTMKQLQIAAAAASLFGVGLAHSATVISSGSTVAAETVFKEVGSIGENTRVRAPAVSYKYDGGVNGSDTVQRFAISLQLSGAGEWATVSNIADALTTNTRIGVSPSLARTIQAFASVRGVFGRIPVLIGDPNNAGSGALDPFPNNTFAIVLNEVVLGDRISPASAPTANQNAVSNTAVTFKFSLINKTGVGVNLDNLDLQFNTFKDAVGATNFAGATSAPDPGTVDAAAGADARDRWLWIWRLNRLSANTSGRSLPTATGETSCNDVPSGFVTLDVKSGTNEPPVVSSEESLNNTGTIRTRVENYLNFARALQVTLAKDADRIIQTTNSFPTNLGANPTNGIGGTGGGRFTFKPSIPATFTPNFGNSIIVNSPTSVGGNPTIGTGVIPPGVALGAAGPGVTLNNASSGDERAAKIGTISFANRTAVRAVLDRLLDSDPYSFKAQVGSGAVGPTPNDSANQASGTGANGDFTVPLAGLGGRPANAFGGVDIGNRDATAANQALTIEFDSKPAYSGFAAGASLTIVKGTSCVGALANAISIIPNPLTLPGIIGATAPLAQRYRWSIPAANLATLAGGATLEGTYQVCYTVPGTTAIPATFFRNVIVTLNKDDVTEQSNTSCQANWAEIYGGVKVDVRNWVVSVPNDDTWSGVTRIINNSEEDTATVEGQFIHPDSGAYGPWGIIAGGQNAAEATALNALVPALKPRAVAYLFNSAIAAKLVNPSSAAGADNSSVLAAAAKGPGRLRVSADVSTIRVQSYIFNSKNNAFTEASASQGADFVNIDSSNRDHIDQDAQRDIAK